ncbi:uncharacterized protein A4U43_C09F15900 [Asparagus officinalis]|uniref:Uncharacterized protein n=1 Tax=Asparagus officinalis TaxID=4686 RepID=A0A5P1E9S5_ASPOF|nr:uncharacterized protein A4U43_C09F15900 [Asparagus officinalis]
MLTTENTLVRQAAMVVKCMLLMYYKNSRGRNYRKQVQSFLAALKALSRKEVNYGSHATTEQSLQEVYLSGNKLSGTIPSSLGNLTQLNKLLIGENALEGSIPPILGNCQALRLLNLSYNQITVNCESEDHGLDYEETVAIYFTQMEGFDAAVPYTKATVIANATVANA